MTISNDTALAIIGMSGRFPGARNVSELWQNLATGTKSIRTFSDEELLAANVDPDLLHAPNYVKAGAILEDIDQFDASFFKFSPREAEMMDPQHRLFLECAYEALQDAAYDPETYAGLIGVFAGSAISTYMLNNVSAKNNFFDEMGRVQVSIGNDRDSLANTISYKLNLRGPSFAVQTFCSTSLIATHLACQSLINYECDIALAGGVAIDVPQVKGYLYEEGSILSPDGECRTFDEKGQGSVMGNGLGVVVLKRLQEALDDGDEIYAVILGSHTNNDGSVRVSYTAPGLDGQSTVIAQAISNAAIDVETISYIEAHGTATLLGDAVELAAMKKAFAARTQKKQFCAIGSVKPNVGHLDRASGVTGLIKTALALKHRQLPPNLNFESATPDVDLNNSPFYVNTQLTEWKTAGFPRRAGVSSFGLGGSNAHVVLEESPERTSSSPSRDRQLLVLSARTATALEMATENLHTHLQQHTAINLADAAYTLQIGRTAFNHRRFLVCRDRTDALAQLAQGTLAHTTCQLHRDRAVAFLFPDVQGHPITFAQELYHKENVFRAAIDELYDQITSLLPDFTVETHFLTMPAEDEILKAVTTFALEYALAQVWLSLSIKPSLVYSHGYGLYAALVLSNILTLTDALTLLIAQARVNAHLGHPDSLQRLLSEVAWHTPQTPFISAITGEQITDEQALDPGFWSQQSRQTTLSRMDRLMQNPELVLLEVGAGETLIGQIRQHLAYDATRNDLLISIKSGSDISGQAALLTSLGQLWLAGVTINWSECYAMEQRLRVSLPTYPFERQRYWLQWNNQSTLLPAIGQPGKKENIADWFYQPVWRQESLPPIHSGQAPQNWWIFEDALGLGTQLAQRLQADGHRVVRIQAGNQFIYRPGMTVQVRPEEADDYIALCRELRAQTLLPDKVVHLWNVTQKDGHKSNPDYFQSIQGNSFYSLIALVQGLNAVIHTEPVHMLVVSNDVHMVTGQEQLIPEKATFLAACKVIPQENLNITCRSLDLVISEQDTLLFENLLKECLTTTTSDELTAYRKGVRWVQHYQPLHLEHVDGQKVPFRPQGVYLITGGLGGVGAILTAHLARTYQARVVLTSRTSLPPHEEWDEWLAQHDEQDDTSVKMRHLLAAEAAGGEVLLLKADVSDAEQMSKVVQEIYARYGALHGVLHAAGVTTPSAFKSTQELTWADCEQHFRPKVYGLYALEQALRGHSLDFCLLFSSVSVVLGGIGFSAYVAGNVFMDAFVQHYRRTTSVPWLCINWDTWLVKENAHTSRGETVASYVMLPDEGTEALTRVLAQNASHIINSTGDLQARIQQWVSLGSAQRDMESSSYPAAAALQTATLSSIRDYERVIIAIWQEVLGVSDVGLYDNFFDLGGNSLIAIQVISKLKKALRIPIPAVALFEAPTVSALVKYMLPDEIEQTVKPGKEKTQQFNREDIAIISMTGRFPGAKNVEEFWQNLRNGVESITFFTEDELIEAGVDPQLVKDPNFVKARPILDREDIESFDATFFGYSPREAEVTDPQHRLFLECCWEALERAGYDPSTYNGSIGVFGGSNLSTYMLGMMNNPAAGPIDDYQLVIGNDKDSLTTSVSYKFNLKGPSFAVQTFCSTSLVATHLACQSLLNGESDIALAGGVSIRVPTRAGHLYQEGGMESPDGHCRTFDAQARGSLFGDGVAVLAFKRLSEALEHGDPILAVIKGSAINNDGSLKVSYTAPSVVGQAEVVTKALTAAGIHPETINYIEAHGTATELGDPIEVASLTKAFRTQTEKSGYCAIGSVKTNIGHLDRAAGATGLIKTVLALQNEEFPPHLHFQSPNPEIDFEQSPFYVNTTLRPWKSNGLPRRAGVNSLGLGGTNAHVIIEEAPIQPTSSTSRTWQMLPLSARTPSALEKVAQNLRTYLQEHPESSLADVAHTLQVGRKKFEHRSVLLCRNHTEAITTLDNSSSTVLQSYERVESRTDRQVAFLFPGLGELYPDIARDLYQAEATFRQHIDTCHDFLSQTYGLDVRGLLKLDQPYDVQHETTPEIDMRSLLKRNSQQHTRIQRNEQLASTALAQPIVFVIEYALARLWMEWGMRPQAMLGYSLGEYTAACIAEVLSLEDTLRLVVERARLIDKVEHGAMVAVMLGEKELQPYLNDQVCLAIQNSATACVLAGSFEAIEHLEKHLQANAVAYRRVETTHAFHSNMLSPLAEAVTSLAQSIKLHAPRIPYISNVTGTWITDKEATDPEYWAHHMCQTVRFADGIGHLLQETNLTLLEVGPGQALSSFARLHPHCDRMRSELVLPTLPATHERIPEHAFVLSTLGKLWAMGSAPDWAGFYNHEHRKRIQLPTYPFERKRYWIDSQPVARASAQVQVNAMTLEERLASLKKEELSNWFYLPGWKYTAPALPFTPSDESIAAATSTHWLLFLDSKGIGMQIKQQLMQNQYEIVTVVPGNAFEKLAENHYSLRPDVRSDYEMLMQQLREMRKIPQRVAHCWMLSAPRTDISEQARLTWALGHGFYSLLALAQALGESDEHCQIAVVTNGLYDLSGNEEIFPERITVAGPCKAIPQEYPNLSCRTIDITLFGKQDRRRASLAQHLLGELQTNSSDPVVALRLNSRWVQTFEPLTLAANKKGTAPLRNGGTYLITGGLGGIGLALAKYIAHTAHANLVLTSRHGLPARKEWNNILARDGETQGIGRQLRQLLDLEATGVKVLPLAADVADGAQMQYVIQQTQERFGVLNGVFHTAGVPGIGLMRHKTPEMAARVLTPKIQGTLVLESVLKHYPLDFFVLFSSITSVIGGGPGQVDYCAANAFLDAYAQQANRVHKTIAINWGEWQWNAWDAGLAGYDSETQAFFRANRNTFGISFDDGMEALQRILAQDFTQIIATTQNFQTFAELSKTYTAASILEKSRDRQTRVKHERPAMRNEYASPQTALERKITGIWESVLGIVGIGLHDNFFDLGGNSLVGIDMINQLRKELQRPTIPSYAIYEAPTVGAMEQLLEQSTSTASQEIRHERSDRRRESLRQRMREPQRAR